MQFLRKYTVIKSYLKPICNSKEKTANTTTPFSYGNQSLLMDHHFQPFLTIMDPPSEYRIKIFI